MTIEFAITWDYRCPFARNVHEHILTALEGGVEWDVFFTPFSLGQGHVEPGQPTVWEQPEQDSGIVALQAGTWVRDHATDQFLTVHRALFDARHREGSRLTADDVRAVLAKHGVDADACFAAIDSGEQLKQVELEHERFVASHQVWGVPTFIVGEDAAFVRLMNGSPKGSDVAEAQRAIEAIVGMLGSWPALNEFKHTTVKS